MSEAQRVPHFVSDHFDKIESARRRDSPRALSRARAQEDVGILHLALAVGDRARKREG